MSPFLCAKKRPPVVQKEEEVVRLPGLSPQAAEGAQGKLVISVKSVKPPPIKKGLTQH
jgi:hypothetical protein